MLPPDPIICVLPSRAGSLGQAACAHALHSKLLFQSDLCRPDEWSPDSETPQCVLSMGPIEHLLRDRHGGTSHIVVLRDVDMDLRTNDAFPIVHQDAAIIPDVGPYERNVDVLEEYMLSWSWNTCRRVLLEREVAQKLTMLVADKQEPTGARLVLTDMISP